MRQRALLISGQTVLQKGMYHDRAHQLVLTVSVGSVVFDLFAAAELVRRDRLKSVRRDVLGVRTRPQILTALVSFAWFRGAALWSYELCGGMCRGVRGVQRFVKSLQEFRGSACEFPGAHDLKVDGR